MLLLCSSLPRVAARQAQLPKCSGRWVGGKWPLEGKMLDTDFSKAITVTGVSNCGWSPDHMFMICDQSLVVDGKPDRDAFGLCLRSRQFDVSLLRSVARRESVRIPATWSSQRGRQSLGVSEQDRRSRARRCSSAPSMSCAALTPSNGGRSTRRDGGAHWIKMGGGSEKRQK